MYSQHQEEEKAAKKEGSLFVNPMPTPYSVKKAKEQNSRMNLISELNFYKKISKARIRIKCFL